MSNLRKIARLAALAGLVLGLSACHYYAPYYGPPGQHGYYGQGTRGHHGRHDQYGHDERDGHRHRGSHEGLYRPYGY